MASVRNEREYTKLPLGRRCASHEPKVAIVFFCNQGALEAPLAKLDLGLQPPHYLALVEYHFPLRLYSLRYYHAIVVIAGRLMGNSDNFGNTCLQRRRATHVRVRQNGSGVNVIRAYHIVQFS